MFNITGYTFYIIYSSVGYFTDIKGAGTVVIADLVFVYHAALMVVIETIQCIIYEVYCDLRKRGKNKISKAAIIIISILWLVEILATLLYLVIHHLIVDRRSLVLLVLESNHCPWLRKASNHTYKVHSSCCLELQKKKYQRMVDFQYYS